MTTSFTHDSRHLAETYERVSDLQFEGGKRLVEGLGLDKTSRVLDLGCGTGRLTRWIAERLGPRGSVAGVDPLAHRIAIARAQSGAVRFDVGQAEDLGAFDDASFDIVCMSAVLHWVADKAKALAEIRRVLRPGGRLGVTTTPDELAGAGTVGLTLGPLLGRAPYAGHVDLTALASGKRCTSTDLVRLVLESGLELVELHVAQHVTQHESGAAFVEFAEASSFGNLLRIVPDELRASLRADLVSAFDAQKGPDGVAIRRWGTRLVAMRAQSQGAGDRGTR